MPTEREAPDRSRCRPRVPGYFRNMIRPPSRVFTGGRAFFLIPARYFSAFSLAILEKTVYDVSGNNKCGSRGVRQHPAACVRVRKHSYTAAFRRAATTIIVFLPASCKRNPQRRVILLRTHFVLVTDAVYEALIHRVYYFRREAGGNSPRASQPAEKCKIPAKTP